MRHERFCARTENHRHRLSQPKSHPPVGAFFRVWMDIFVNKLVPVLLLPRSFSARGVFWFCGTIGARARNELSSQPDDAAVPKTAAPSPIAPSLTGWQTARPSKPHADFSDTHVTLRVRPQSLAARRSIACVVQQMWVCALRSAFCSRARMWCPECGYHWYTLANTMAYTWTWHIHELFEHINETSNANIHTRMDTYTYVTKRHTWPTHVRTHTHFNASHHISIAHESARCVLHNKLITQKLTNTTQYIIFIWGQSDKSLTNQWQGDVGFA